MKLGEIISIGREVGQLFNKVLDQLPTHDQRKMDEFFKFIDKYKQEIARPDRDNDDLLLWYERYNVMLESIIKEISRKK